MGMNSIDPDFDGRLKASYDHAMAKGTWKDTYAATNYKEYWAEGVRAYFDCAAPPQPRNHNDINTREKLEKSDPELFGLIDEVFKQNKWRYVRYDKRHAPTAEPPREPAPGGTAADYERAAKLRAPDAEQGEQGVGGAALVGGRRPLLVSQGPGRRRPRVHPGGRSEGRAQGRVRRREAGGGADEGRRQGLPGGPAADRRPAFDVKGEAFWLKVGGKTWKCDTGDYTLDEEEFPKEAAPAAPLKDDPPPRRPPPRGPDSPDGKWTAFVKDDNLYLREKDDRQGVARSAQEGRPTTATPARCSGRPTARS